MMGHIMRVNSLWRVLAIVTCLALVAFVCTQPQVSNDFWLQAKVGELIVQHGSIPDTLLFPFTDAEHYKFNAHEWLPSVFFYYLIRVFGEGSLPLALGLSGVLLFVLVTSIASIRAGGNLGIGLLCGLLAMVLENYRHFLRPELLSLFFLVMYCHGLDLLRNRWRWDICAALICLAILWANTHASFILASMIALLYAVGCWCDDHWLKTGRRSAHLHPTAGRYFFALSIVVFAVALVNPLGVRLITFLFEFGGSSVSREVILEWFPTFDPRLMHTPALWLALCSAMALIAYGLHSWRNIGTFDILLVSFFLVLGIKAFRFWVYLGVVAALVIPVSIRNFAPHQNSQRMLLQCSTVVSLALLLVACRFGNINGNFPYKSDFNEVFTQPMISFLASERIRGNVYTSYDLGAELVYRAYPRLRPSIDSRIDSYGDAYFRMHEKMLTDHQAMSAFVQKYDVKYILLTQSDFQTFSHANPMLLREWRSIIKDKRAIFLERVQ